ncbi:hypothetical protein [Ottowia sp. oral taxon 894]|uniref:hypothetical protein n=1 Tax=Ottowia sp. oral taxon 894 TaxID=1658672 RepID=UPI0012E31A09|nr:hypothetical protein [Ottowia sp. oral taxon 894]
MKDPKTWLSLSAHYEKQYTIKKIQALSLFILSENIHQAPDVKNEYEQRKNQIKPLRSQAGPLEWLETGKQGPTKNRPKAAFLLLA